eukprot:1353964-Amphidinium_carterae.1
MIAARHLLLQVIHILCQELNDPTAKNPTHTSGAPNSNSCTAVCAFVRSNELPSTLFFVACANATRESLLHNCAADGRNDVTIFIQLLCRTHS